MPHRDVLSEDTIFNVSTKHLVDEFLTDETAANKKYLDKVIRVSGPIVAIDKDMNNQAIFILKDQDQAAGVRSTFTANSNPDVEQYAVGDQIEIKGIVRAGAAYLANLYLVEHVILEKAVIVE